MDCSWDWRQAGIYGPSYRLETCCSTWTIIQTGDRLIYMGHPTDCRQAAPHGPSYNIEIGCSTWTIIQNENRLLHMDHPTD